jgi:hypothetical protein
MYIFAHAKLQFDKSDEVKSIQKKLLNYFKNNSEIQQDWSLIADNHRQEKESYGVGQTSIFDIYAELDRKYSS